MKPKSLLSLWRNPPTCPPKLEERRRKPDRLLQDGGRRRIRVRVKPNAKEEKVEPLTNGDFVVRVKAPPREGKANEAVIRVLSEYFGRPKSSIKIRVGASGKIKIIDIT